LLNSSSSSQFALPPVAPFETLRGRGEGVSSVLSAYIAAKEYDGRMGCMIGAKSLAYRVGKSIQGYLSALRTVPIKTLPESPADRA